MKWVKELPCIVCGYGPSDNAHAWGEGTGRKGPAEAILPLCSFLHHTELHRIGIKTFEAKYGVDLKAAAATTDSLWRALHP